MINKYFLRKFATGLGLGLALATASCDRMITPRNAQIIKDAENKIADGNFLRAITLWRSTIPRARKCVPAGPAYGDRCTTRFMPCITSAFSFCASGPRHHGRISEKDELELGTTPPAAPP